MKREFHSLSVLKNLYKDINSRKFIQFCATDGHLVAYTKLYSNFYLLTKTYNNENIIKTIHTSDQFALIVN